jgi:hypothetical protein
MRKAAILALWLVLGSSAAWAQCSMCAASADAADAQGKQAMKRAVTLLAVPPLVIMGGFVAYAVRRNRQDD